MRYLFLTISIALFFHEIFPQTPTNHLDGPTKLVNPYGRTLLLERDDEDSWLTFHDPGNSWYSFGIDKSDGAKLKLNYGSTVGENNHLTILSSGNVGIGTTSPSSNFHLHAPSSATPISAFVIEVNSFSTTANAFNSSYFSVRDVGANHVPFMIEGSGRIGMGTSDPIEKLDVRGNIHLPVGQSIGHLPSGDRFSYNNNTVGNYSIGWFSDPAFNAGSPVGYISSYGGMKFFTQGSTRMAIKKNGDVGIGTTSPDAKLTVNGDIHAKEVRVDLTVPGPDYVFEDDYDLPTLESLKDYIRENKRLPEVPSAGEMEANGIDIGEMNILLLKKVEELTLYQIELLEMLKSQQDEIYHLKKQLK